LAENPKDSLPLGLSTRLRKNKFSTAEYTFTQNSNSLVSGCLSYYDRMGEEFTYNHKTFTEIFYKGLREVGINYKETKINGLKRVQGIKWREGIFAGDFELDTGTETPVKESYLDDWTSKHLLKFLKECNCLRLHTPYLGERDLLFNETFFIEFNDFLKNLKNSPFYTFLKQNSEGEWGSQKLIFLLTLPHLFDRALWLSMKPDLFQFTSDFSDEKSVSTELITEILFIDFMFSRISLEPEACINVKTSCDLYKEFLAKDKEKLFETLKEVNPVLHIPENLNVIYDFKEFCIKYFYTLSLSSPEKSFLFLDKEKTQFINKSGKTVCKDFTLPCTPLFELQRCIIPWAWDLYDSNEYENFIKRVEKSEIILNSYIILITEF
jgi:hypothetical protein